MASVESVICERDGTPTKLTCAQCRTPICPQCLVKTPVGMKCQGCGDPGAARRRAGRRWATLVPIGVAVLVGAAIAIPSMFSNSSNSSTTQTLPPAVPRFLPKDNVGPIGLEVRDGDLAFTVASFQCGATQVSNGTVNRLAQGKYCFMAIDMTNTGRNPATFLLPSQMLNDDQKRMFGPDLAATAAYPDNTGRDLGALVINPGNKVHGVVVYDIPQAEAPTYVNLHAGPTGSGAYVGPLPAS